jgi:hypothetical protein
LPQYKAHAVAAVVLAPYPLGVPRTDPPRHHAEVGQVLQQLPLVVGHLLQRLDGQETVACKGKARLAGDGVELVVRLESPQHVALSRTPEALLTLVRSLASLKVGCATQYHATGVIFIVPDSKGAK